MFPVTILIGCGLLFWNIIRNKFPYEYMSDIHAGTSFILSIITVINILPDMILFAWSISYFMVDLIEVAVNLDIPYIIHHICSIAIPIFGVLDPVLTLGTNSGAYIMIIEYSTVLLNHWLRNRNSAGAYFELIIVYFFNRLIYLSYLLYFSFISRPSNTFGKIALIFLRILHLLMFVWFYKMLRKFKRYF